MVGDAVGLVEALGERRAVIVGHDWGAPVAWNAAQWRPDIFRAVAALSVPFADRAPMAPTVTMKATFGDRFFYILYFQRPGVAEHELQHDVRTSLRRLLFGASGNASDLGVDAMMNPPPKTAYFLDQLADPDVLPPWLTEADLDYFTAEFTRRGFRGGLNWYRNLDRTWALSAPFKGKKIEQPALFISGDRDLIRMNPGFEAAMRAVVPNLRDVVMLPGIGHWTQQEAPAEVNRALIGFLRSLD
jgi:pimeloyl-ACP methyl ester carboxylesterase